MPEYRNLGTPKRRADGTIIGTGEVFEPTEAELRSVQRPNSPYELVRETKVDVVATDSQLARSRKTKRRVFGFVANDPALTPKDDVEREGEDAADD